MRNLLICCLSMIGLLCSSCAHSREELAKQRSQAAWEQNLKSEQMIRPEPAKVSAQSMSPQEAEQRQRVLRMRDQMDRERAQRQAPSEEDPLVEATRIQAMGMMLFGGGPRFVTPRSQPVYPAQRPQLNCFTTNYGMNGTTSCD